MVHTRRSPLAVALIVVTLPWSLACQVSNQSPSGNGAAHDAERSAPAPAAVDASAADRDDSPIGGQALSDEFIARMLAPWNGDLPGIKERRYLRMLVTFNRTHYFADRLEQHGLSYDAGELFETFLNQRLKMKTVEMHVVFIPVTRDRLFQALAEGKGDIAAAGLTVTPERETRVTFTPPFATNVREIVVTSATQPPVAAAEDLSGRSVHVRRSSSYFQSLTDLNRRLAAQGKAPVNIVTVPEALETEDLLEMANADLIPITIADDYLADFWAMVFDGIRLQPASVKTGGQIAWAVRKDAPELQQAADAFIRANPKGSTSFNLIHQRYLKNADYVKNATSERDMEKFRQIRGLFEKYGDQYDLPWPLLAAQAYQESQLNQAKTSRAGAVGLMQIKPSTAAGSPINITGVATSADRNIQAGVKYLRFIVDEYYEDTAIDPVNKALFAIASYNAGPERISQLRRRAAALGFDPDTWFGNVEVIAAREIGRETVNYVGNVFKYYVSYRLALQQIEARRRARGF